MHLRLRDSLLTSMAIVMTTIALLAFASMSASIFLADTTQGLATAINESGALRMRSYRIASNLTHNTNNLDIHWQPTYQLISEFEAHLNSHHLTTVIPNITDSELNLAYQRVRLRWQNEIKPLFDVYFDDIGFLPEGNIGPDTSLAQDTVKNLRNRYLSVVSDFVTDIDKLVSLLEENAETKIQELRRLQFIALTLTTLLTIIALRLIYRRIHTPLKQLLTGAERVSQRDFSFHINYTGKDELGRLGLAFNAMADDLSKVYNHLEDRIKQKTADLEQSNQSLQLLYRTVNRLNQAEFPHSTYASILHDIQHIAKIGRGAIYLTKPDEKKARLLASTLLADASQPADNNSNIQTISLPISDKTQQYGKLIIQPDDSQKLEDWQQQLLETIASHIGIAIKLSHQSIESRRLVLIEERGAIARELHDSLAQSLTYMKIQLSRLYALTKDSGSEETLIISDLRLGLNSAYRELRELLTTFRLKIDGKDFDHALAKTILEFNDRSDTDIVFDNQISFYTLTPNEEIHILHLIREALSNVVQHAQASNACVCIKYNAKGDIEISIKDNGTGINESISKTHHYGLNIMKERCKTLNGSFVIKDNDSAGTHVLLSFTPSINTTAHALTS
ncbi:MAG: histidine kinase [Gammaproteobacteria bacterium]|nr:histidine kinase [Gammaproteobacteria bacterium]